MSKPDRLHYSHGSLHIYRKVTQRRLLGNTYFLSLVSFLSYVRGYLTPTLLKNYRRHSDRLLLKSGPRPWTRTLKNLEPDPEKPGT